MYNIVFVPGKFLSTLSLRRATRPVSALYSVNRYFYPRSPCGERRHFSSKQRTLPKFLSTLSLRRATVSQHSPSTVHTKFLSTLSLRRATIFFCSLLLLFDISIHALLAESDKIKDFVYLYNFISIHALLAESDGLSMLYDTTALIFLSTLSLRRATIIGQRIGIRIDISIHALLAESDLYRQNYECFQWIISIHALLAESDGIMVFCGPQGSGISIHALLAESDDLEPSKTRRLTISIHALLAESDFGAFMRFLYSLFISIHALLAESDIKIRFLFRLTKKFLSTLSLRRATLGRRKRNLILINFYPRSPCGERRKVPILGIK